MQGFIAMISIMTQMAGGVPVEPAFEYIGQMSEIVVTAPRYEYEDESWAGLLKTVVVTAPRYEYADNAWSGLMETVIVTVSRHDGEDVNIAGTTNGNNNQSSGTDINYTPSMSNEIHVVLMLAAMGLILLLFLVPQFRHKSLNPAKEMCCCEQ